MRYFQKLSRILPVLVIAGIASADAALVQTGTRAGTEIANCSGSCTIFNFGPVFGGAGSTSSGVSSISDFRGRARASASLSGGLSTPVLKAEAFAKSSFYGAFASAYGVQRYTYAGLGETLMLNVDLDGLVNDPETNAGNTRAFLEVVLYAPEPFSFGVSRSKEQQLGITPLVQTDLSEASVFLQLDHLNPSSDTGQISVDVTTGDEFYISAFLIAEARSGISPTSANAFNTGTLSFVGNPNLIAASPVPLPAGIYLLGLGLVALFRSSRLIVQ